METIDAALSAPKAEAVTVKALEWEPYPSDGSLLSEGQNQKRNYVERALTPWGSAIFLMEKDGLYSLRGANDLEARSYDSQEAAKSSAFFEFFAPCILSAVAPVPAITDDAVERVLKDAEKKFEEIRIVLIRQLAEPERSAFWKAVAGRNAIRALLAATRALGGRGG